MPGMNGYLTCEKLKSNDISKNIPILFLSALSTIEEKVKGFHTGAVDYVTKPIQADELLARIRTHIKLKKLTDNLESEVEIRTIEVNRKIQETQELNIKLQHEIEEHKQTEKSLIESRKQFKSLVEMTSDWIWEIDLKCLYTYSSPKVIELIDYKPEDLQGSEIFDFMHPEERESSKKLYRSNIENVTNFESIIVRLKHKNDSDVYSRLLEK